MKQILVILLLLCLGTFLTAISIEHYSPKSYSFGSDVELRLRVEDGFDQIKTATLMFRPLGKTSWQKLVLKSEPTDRLWMVGELKAADLKDYIIEYYFEVQMIDGTVTNLPATSAPEPRYQLSPGLMRGEKSAAFILLSDDNGAKQSGDYILAVSFFEIADEIDLGSIKVLVGGKDVTKASIITENAVLYRDSNPGTGDVRSMVGAKVGGKDLYSELWTTRVTGGKGFLFVPSNIRGSANFVSNVYDYNNESGTPAGQTLDDATGRLDLYGNFGKVNVLTNLLVSSLETSNRQPVNRYTLGFEIPMLDVYLGDYSPNLSQFTIANKNVRGLYSRFHTKFLSLVWTHGEMVRKTYNAVVDTTGSIVFGTGTYKQEAIGARFQMGGDSGFQLGISGSRNRDLISSQDPRKFAYFTTAGDTLYTINPQDNAVMSLDMRFNMPDQNIILGGEIAGSMHNKNTLSGPMSDSTFTEFVGDDFPIELTPSDLADFFIINENVEPLLPGRQNIAFTGYMRALIMGNYLDLRYTETGPAFRSQSSYYLANDTRQIQVNDQINIMNMLYLNGGVNLTTDNLSDTKEQTNTTLSWNAQATLRLARLPYFKAGFFNNDYSNEQNTEIIPISPFVPYTRNAQTLSLGMGYNLTMIPVAPTSLDLTFRSGNDDSFLHEPGVMQYKNQNNSINVTMTNRFKTIPLKTQVLFTLYNQKRDETGNAAVYPLYDNQNSNISIAVDYLLFNKILRPYFQWRMLSLSGDQDPQSYNYYNLGVEAFPWRNLSISTELGKQYYSNDNDSTRDYDNLTWRLLLNQRF